MEAVVVGKVAFVERGARLWLQADLVVHGQPEPLLAAEVTLGRLYRNVSEQELESAQALLPQRGRAWRKFGGNRAATAWQCRPGRRSPSPRARSPSPVIPFPQTVPARMTQRKTGPSVMGAALSTHRLLP